MPHLTPQLIQKQFESIRCWQKSGARAPNKPLLLLLELSRIENGFDRLAPFEEIDRALRPLLREFGPYRKSIHTEYPFWRLQNDNQYTPFWEVENAHLCMPREGNTDAKKSDLLRLNIRAGFSQTSHDLLNQNTGLRSDLIFYLLDQNFPESLHPEILGALGIKHPKILRDSVIVTKKKRDPNFRKEVLTAYKYNCAICRSSIRLGDVTIGLEAAHIKWHQADGPDSLNNGLALCAMHHRLFDLGAFTLKKHEDKTILLLSDESNGTGLDHWLLPFKDKAIDVPHHKKDIPSEKFLNWHSSEVFKGSPVSNVLSC